MWQITRGYPQILAQFQYSTMVRVWDCWRKNHDCWPRIWWWLQQQKWWSNGETLGLSCELVPGFLNRWVGFYITLTYFNNWESFLLDMSSRFFTKINQETNGDSTWEFNINPGSLGGPEKDHRVEPGVPRARGLIRVFFNWWYSLVYFFGTTFLSIMFFFFYS